jgi:hypothetical protein
MFNSLLGYVAFPPQKATRGATKDREHALGARTKLRKPPSVARYCQGRSPGSQGELAEPSRIAPVA